ncbi:uncharacterized protein LOC118310602 [Scophthalmus maximus]|uniref:uncharacterized protein LOC118310602 n=1 Tax=Scophthalmus maximus TaxID=52904 RepID=UPI001FA8C85E|nr:uncharacterized protein LOC118310602 [Scophthalmus maximus]
MQTNRNNPRMKTSLAVLGLSLFHLCVAELLPQQQDGDMNSMESPGIEQAGPIAGDVTESPRYSSHLDVSIREAEQQNTERQLEELKREDQGNREAFGESFDNVGNTGPYNTEITLPHRSDGDNTGAYSPSAGIFTAPVKGVYHFSFSGQTVSTKPMGLRLMKTINHPDGRRYETANNVMTLPLNEGDQVYMRLRRRIHFRIRIRIRIRISIHLHVHISH